MTNIDRIRPQSKRKMLSAYAFCTRYLAEANEAEERGDKTKAHKLYAKSQYWLDRYNTLAEQRGEASSIGDLADDVVSQVLLLSRFRKILEGFDKTGQKTLIMGWRLDHYITDEQCQYLIKEYGLESA